MKQKYVYILVLTMLTACLMLFAACNNEQTQQQSVEYNIHFSVDGEVVHTWQASNGQKLVIPTEPAKEGYLFNGWFLDDGVWTQMFSQDSLTALSSTKDVTVYAKYTPLKYTLSYEPGRDMTHANPAEYTVEQHVSLQPATKQDYDFVGWFTDAELSQQIFEIPAGFTGAMTLYAKFEPTEYKAVFMDGETVVAEVAYTVETKRIAAPEVPEHAGYVGEWESYELIPGGVTVQAKYTSVDYQITYEGVKASEHKNPAGYNLDKQPLALQDAQREHYVFAGWYTDAEYNNRITEIAPGITGNLTLYAKWEPAQYMAVFMDGEDVVAEVPYTVETESITAPELPVHVGYTGEWETFTLTPGGITVNAVYTLVEYKITYENVDADSHENPLVYDVTKQPIALGDAVREHYIFDGWYTDAEYTERLTEIAANTAGDLTLYAKWTPVQYTATFNDGTTESKITFTVETESITPPDLTKRSGYTGAWESFELLLEDFTVNAVYTLNDYQITYNNTKDVLHINPETYTVESDTILLAALAKPGYTFDGWYSDAACTTSITEIVTGTTGDLAIYAKWTPITYALKLHFNPEQGKYADAANPTTYTVENQIVLKDLICTVPGYAFDGWYTEKSVGAGTRVTEIAIGSVNDLELYAHFVPIRYTITYVGAEDATNMNPDSYTIESEAVNILPAVREGYIFGGWFSDAALSVPASSLIPAGSTGNVTLYTKWTPVTYVIEYDAQGGNLPENPAVFNITQTVTFAAPTKQGYLFKGWFTEAKGGELVTEIKAGTTTNNVKLYAQWDPVYYSITYYTYGGENPMIGIEDLLQMNPMDIWMGNYKGNLPLYICDLPALNLQDATKPGYKFEGWYADPEYTQPVSKILPKECKDIVLYAKWSLVTYKVTYVLPEGATHENVATYTVQDQIKPLAAATMEGYTFVGWFKDEEGTQPISHLFGTGTYSDLTLYAKFVPKQYKVWLGSDKNTGYTVSFDLNGGKGENFKQTVTMEQGLEFPTIPVRDGHVFAGWYDNAECKGDMFDMSAAVTKDITLYAKWIKTAAFVYVNTPVDVTLKGVTKQSFTFIPLTDAVVTITTLGESDTCGILYDAAGNVLARNDDASGANKNFHIEYYVMANTEYTISVYGYSDAVQGKVQLSVTGYATVPAGGKALLDNLYVISTDETFTLSVPSPRPDYKFLGWEDKDGKLYTDENGVGLTAWKTDSNVVLTEKWEKLA